MNTKGKVIAGIFGICCATSYPPYARGDEAFPIEATAALDEPLAGILKMQAMADTCGLAGPLALRLRDETNAALAQALEDHPELVGRMDAFAVTTAVYRIAFGRGFADGLDAPPRTDDKKKTICTALALVLAKRYGEIK